jgi:hypothetical protein
VLGFEKEQLEEVSWAFEEVNGAFLLFNDSRNAVLRGGGAYVKLNTML